MTVEELIQELTKRVNELEQKLSSMPTIAAAKPSSKAREILGKSSRAENKEQGDGGNESSPEESPPEIEENKNHGSNDQLKIADLEEAWETIVKGMSKRARSRLAASKIVEVVGNEVVIGLPNEPHRARCEELVEDIKEALSSRFAVAVDLQLIVASAAIEKPEPKSEKAQDVEEVDITESTSAEQFEGSATDQIIKAFPGAEIIDSES